MPQRKVSIRDRHGEEKDIAKKTTLAASGSDWTFKSGIRNGVSTIRKFLTAVRKIAAVSPLLKSDFGWPQKEWDTSWASFRK